MLITLRIYVAYEKKLLPYKCWDGEKIFRLCLSMKKNILGSQFDWKKYLGSDGKPSPHHQKVKWLLPDRLVQIIYGLLSRSINIKNVYISKNMTMGIHIDVSYWSEYQKYMKYTQCNEAYSIYVMTEFCTPCIYNVHKLYYCCTWSMHKLHIKYTGCGQNRHILHSIQSILHVH